ncbi:uroporphyrinogen-III synthase [Legionella bononiensis]|uniref:Uroporphyrinogen-III synthase n=1 Tax=Legionella bononiensis TaxID=2793102 RepID=A0ABS1W9Y6_9GAMM|nr:uroporphyrinogen-III synthase [Legionella bononiensis]MBL7480640.1 uroporphyrinogen-III synthase [Legionella bononiensis]MBL7526161.1 uroporphyrinogen-III synthase [Legionella bononiensis]MBL7563344.1 uroporphyrinogen-III synthase [Legionella bononiensis]
MSQSLHGLRVLNTRPQKQAYALNSAITEAGGIAIACPTLEIVESEVPWINSLPNLKNVSQAIFISANAVHYCFTQLFRHNIAWPKHINVIAIGKGSAKELSKFHIEINDIPDVPDSEHLLALHCLQQLKNQTVLLFKGEGGRPLIEQTLIEKGANLCSLAVYKRVMPEVHHQLINSLWREDLVDIILLTSEQSMHNLFKMFCKEAHDWLKNKPAIVLSERLANSAALSGITKIIISHPDRMMSTLFDYYQGLIHGK